jgi:hypothetical protein
VSISRIMRIMTFWLVNAGTMTDPLRPGRGAVEAEFMKWERMRGPTHGLDRSYRMRPGEVLVYRSVGTLVSRLVAVATVLAPPEEKPFRQWRFQVPRRIESLVATLRDAPPFDLLETAAVRMTKRLDPSVGAKAVELVRSAAQRSKD